MKRVVIGNVKGLKTLLAICGDVTVLEALEILNADVFGVEGGK